MKKVFLSAGHGDRLSKDRGAKASYELVTIYEGDLTIALRNAIKDELALLGVNAVIDNDRNILSDTLNFIKGMFTEECLLIDIHWNAFNGKASGSEVIIPKVYSTKELETATEILKALISFGFKNRGVKTEDKTARKTLGWMRPKGQNILIEVCFMDNKKDMDTYFKNKQALAKKIAEVIKSKL
jgi:N-acetylmuramoyl-L-alanine amidase